MSKDDNKVQVLTIPAEDAVQLALDNYDSSPNSQNPKLLVTNRAVTMIPIDPEQLPKGFAKDRNLIDINTGELLGLGMLAQFFGQMDNQLYDIVASVEDAWNPERETLISDGALIVHGKSSRMIVQQVMAQDLYGPRAASGNIEDEIIRNISDKNERMRTNQYPEKSALLVSVYTEQARIDLGKITNGADTTVFPSYYLIRYKLPDLAEAKVFVLGGDAIPARSILEWKHFILQRYDNPYGDE